jgi:hypothetical protein
MPSHVSLPPEVPENDEWPKNFHPTISQHRGWPNLSPASPPLTVNPNVHISPTHLPVQSSNTSKRLKTEAHHMHDKGKYVASPSSPSSDSAKSISSHIHLRDDYSHVINEIKPQGSTEPKANLGKSK